MASSREYLEFVSEQLSQLSEISFRPMMGEYIIYYKGKVVGGIYDERFLVKPTTGGLAMTENARLEEPYPGGKAMLLVEDIENKEYVALLIQKTEEELPAPKKRK